MTITAHYRGQLAAEKACDSLEVEAGTRLRALLADIAEREGGAFRDLILDAGGGVQRTLLIAVDGEQVVDMEAPLPDGTREIMLLPSIAGG